MRVLATRLTINGAQILSLTTLACFRIPLKVPSTLQLFSRFRTRISQCPDVLLCCLSLVRIQSYLRIIISLKLSVPLTQHRLGYFCTHYHLGGGGESRIRPPPLLSREPMVVSSPARRRSKALHEIFSIHT